MGKKMNDASESRTAVPAVDYLVPNVFETQSKMTKLTVNNRLQPFHDSSTGSRAQW